MVSVWLEPHNLRDWLRRLKEKTKGLCLFFLVQRKGPTLMFELLADVPWKQRARKKWQRKIVDHGGN